MELLKRPLLSRKDWLQDTSGERLVEQEPASPTVQGHRSLERWADGGDLLMFTRTALAVACAE